MRVLGIDPGLTRCGLGVVDGVPGRPPTLVAVDVVRTPADLDTARRLVRIEAEIEEWITAHRPDAVAVERVFAQHNVQTVMGTAQAAGVAMLVAARHGNPVALHTPSEVKAAITGSGRAGKDQVGSMVARILQLEAVPKPADAADALALAICHVWRGSSRPAAGGHRRARTQEAQKSMIAQLSGTVIQLGPTSAVVEVGGFGVLALCSPDTPAAAPGGAADDAVHLAGGPRGLADPVRLRHRRRARVLRAAADRDRGRARSWPRPPSPCSPRTSCGPPSPPRTWCSSARCRASVARARSGS